MGRTNEEQEFLEREIEDAKTKVTVGAGYWHYKSRDKVYKIIDLGFIEATDEICVIYKAQYGKRLTLMPAHSVSGSRKLNGMGENSP